MKTLVPGFLVLTLVFSFLSSILGVQPKTVVSAANASVGCTTLHRAGACPSSSEGTGDFHCTPGDASAQPVYIGEIQAASGRCEHPALT